MMNKITTFSKLLFAGAAVVFFSFSASAQDLMQENDVKTEVTEGSLEASNANEPKSLLSPTQVQELQYAAPAPEEAAPKATKKATKVNPVKAAIAVAKINKMIKKASKINSANEKDKVKGGGGLSQNMKLGIIIAAIGLIIALLGGFIWGTTGGILVALGIIALIIGLIIIIVEFVNNDM